MKIRSATGEDIEPLAAAYVAAFAAVDPSERWTVERAAALVSFFLRAQPDLAFAAEEEGRVVGGIFGLSKPWWDGDHLVETEIFVLPEHRRQGIATALFERFLETARAAYGATFMESITFKDPPFPSSWYKKLGFTEKPDWKVLFGEPGLLVGRLVRARSDAS